MQETELLQLWKSYDQQLAESLSFNRRQAAEITRLKVRSYLSSMTPVKMFTVLTGLVWVMAVDWIIVHAFAYASPFFLASAIIQVLLTKLAIAVYLYQLVLIYRVDIDEPIVHTQLRVARLTASTIWITRLLFLQLPIWTTFYLSRRLLEGASFPVLLFQILLTLLFTVAAIWLFMNIRPANKDKKWFRLIFRGREWTPLMRALDILEESREYDQKK